MRLRGEERRAGKELRWREMRRQRKCHECGAPHWLELQRAAHLLDRAAHRSDALQTVMLGQQGFVDDDRLSVLNDDDALLPE